MSQSWKEQEESATRNGGNERVGNMATRASCSQLTVPWRLLCLSVLSSPVIVHAKVMEVSSTRQGEEKRPEAGSWKREETIHVNSTPQFARVTHANTFACGSRGAHASQLALFCVISHTSHLDRLISCRTSNAHGLTAFFFYFRTALHLRFVLHMAFSFAVLPNSAP